MLIRQYCAYRPVFSSIISFTEHTFNKNLLFRIAHSAFDDILFNTILMLGTCLSSNDTRYESYHDPITHTQYDSVILRLILSDRLFYPADTIHWQYD